MPAIMPTVQEIEIFFAAWGPIVQAAAGAEIIDAIAAGQRESENWTDEQRVRWIMEGIHPNQT
jgi:hypothetical protein